MKKITLSLFVYLLVWGAFVSTPYAGLTTIGTATYYGSSYNLIYDDDAPMGPIVWLDYRKETDYWQNQKDWADGLGSQLTINLNPGYVAHFDWSTGWRLPETVDGEYEEGYEGDPNGDGNYSYTAGYNLANSEMGHLYYTELGNIGQYDTDGNQQAGYGLNNTGPFDQLVSTWYWSETEYGGDLENFAWYFTMYYGKQDIGNSISSKNYALAVHPGTVSSVPIPGALWLFGSGLVTLAGLRKRRGNEQIR